MTNLPRNRLRALGPLPNGAEHAPLIGQQPQAPQPHQLILAHAQQILSAPFDFQQITDMVRGQIEQQPTDAAKAEVREISEALSAMAMCQMTLRACAAARAARINVERLRAAEDAMGPAPATPDSGETNSGLLEP